MTQTLYIPKPGERVRIVETYYYSYDDRYLGETIVVHAAAPEPKLPGWAFVWFYEPEGAPGRNTDGLKCIFAHVEPVITEQPTPTPQRPTHLVKTKYLSSFDGNIEQEIRPHTHIEPVTTEQPAPTPPQPTLYIPKPGERVRITETLHSVMANLRGRAITITATLHTIEAKHGSGWIHIAGVLDDDAHTILLHARVEPIHSTNQEPSPSLTTPVTKPMCHCGQELFGEECIALSICGDCRAGKPEAPIDQRILDAQPEVIEHAWMTPTSEGP